MDKKQRIRCAIYTRKSVEDGLEQEFNSLDAQRDAAENYIASQKSKGWVCLPDHYDDGGYSGGNTKRPGLQRMLEDIKAGKIDVVVVYKIDRLSRSICDFGDLSKTFDKYGVSFVSVTQDINTSTSAGRMVLNILVTFSAYEREVTAERIRDKMAASRKKGLWVGGSVAFGYTSENKKLIVVPEEAETVRWIFNRFLETRSPKLICTELNEAKKLRKDGGIWNRSHIYRLLGNHTYIGKVKYKNEVYAGEQEAIIDEKIWDEVQQHLRDADPLRNLPARNRQETVAPLKGLIRCGHCGGSMGPNYTRKGSRKYLYYICMTDTKRAVRSCPVRRVAADDLESIILDQIEEMLRSPQVQEQLIGEDLDADTVKRYTEQFATIWQAIFPIEQYRILHLLIEHVDVYEDHLDIEFRTGGIKDLIKELTDENN